MSGAAEGSEEKGSGWLKRLLPSSDLTGSSVFCRLTRNLTLRFCKKMQRIASSSIRYLARCYKNTLNGVARTNVVSASFTRRRGQWLTPNPQVAGTPAGMLRETRHEWIRASLASCLVPMFHPSTSRRSTREAVISANTHRRESFAGPPSYLTTVDTISSRSS